LEQLSYGNLWTISDICQWFSRACQTIVTWCQGWLRTAFSEREPFTLRTRLRTQHSFTEREREREPDSSSVREHEREREQGTTCKLEHEHEHEAEREREREHAQQCMQQKNLADITEHRMNSQAWHWLKLNLTKMLVALTSLPDPRFCEPKLNTQDSRRLHSSLL
jgi:hypothetical protein